MLRDIAHIFKGTQSQFEVGWDEKNFAISLTTDEPYTGEGVGFNMTKPHIKETGLKSSATIFKNGKEIKILGYTINGNTYFKIRDLGYELNIDVSWDEINKIVVLKSDNITIDEDIKKHTTEAQKQEMREYMLKLINEARQERGLVKLELDDTLTEIAEYKSADLKETGVFSHDGSYGTHRDLMAMFDHTYTYTGENIAMGQISAEMLFNSWWSSEGHRENMMRPEFRKIGIGFADKEYNIRGLYNVPDDLENKVEYNETLEIYVHEGWSYYASQIFGN